MRICPVFFLVAAGSGEAVGGRMSGVESYKTQTPKHRPLDQFRMTLNFLCPFPYTSVFSGKNKILFRVRKDENTGHNL